MLELRWIVRMVDRERGIDDGFIVPPLPDKIETRVLQYREGIYPYQDPHGCVWEGTEWQIVPTIKEQPERV